MASHFRMQRSTMTIQLAPADDMNVVEIARSFFNFVENIKASPLSRLLHGQIYNGITCSFQSTIRYFTNSPTIHSDRRKKDNNDDKYRVFLVKQ